MVTLIGKGNRMARFEPARRYGWCLMVIILQLVVSVAQVTNADTILYVDQNAVGPVYDGWSWCTAFTDLQDALDIAVWDVTIRVADGTYTPDRGTVDPSETFVLANNIRIEGGFAGCEAPDPNERNYALHQTILSGDLLGNDAGGVSSETGLDNSIHVVSVLSSNSTPELDGFVITGGYARGESRSGGGVYVLAGRPSLKNCRISQNRAEHDGAGVHGPILGSISFHNCVFRDNYAERNGGGLYADAQCLIDQCDFDSNRAISGAGMFSHGNSTLTDCMFINNSASANGGGVFVTSHDPTLSRIVLAGNSAASRGGGLFAAGGTSPAVDNCILSGNSAEEGGGAYVNSTGNLVMINCTLSENTAARGGAIYSDGATNLNSSIVWGGGSQVTGSFSGITITHSNVFGGWPGGNIFAIPQFLDADGLDDVAGTLDDDLRLLPESPCIDTGDPTVTYDPTETDLDGNPRVVHERIDMGAYESSSNCAGDDFDGDGVPDACDPDIDEDGVANGIDVCGFTPLGTPVDVVGRPLMDLDGDCDTDLVDLQWFQLGFTGPR